jgi:hypothetical protein
MGDDVFNVEKIVGVRAFETQLQYRVRWEGYAPSEDTWEPLSHLDSCTQEVERFNRDNEEQYLKALKALQDNTNNAEKKQERLRKKHEELRHQVLSPERQRQKGIELVVSEKRHSKKTTGNVGFIAPDFSSGYRPRTKMSLFGDMNSYLNQLKSKVANIQQSSRSSSHEFVQRAASPVTKVERAPVPIIKSSDSHRDSEASGDFSRLFNTGGAPDADEFSIVQTVEVEDFIPEFEDSRKRQSLRFLFKGDSLILDIGSTEPNIAKEL